MAEKKKAATKKTVTWKCPNCSTKVEHSGNVTSHSHSCAGSTVELEPVG